MKLGGETICVDFDGVLHSYTSGWTGPVPEDPPMDGALEFINWLHEQGAKVVVLTTRAKTEEGKKATEDWLKRYNFPSLSVTDKKIPAAAYIDDRGVNFSGDWTWVKEQLSDLEKTSGLVFIARGDVSCVMAPLDIGTKPIQDQIADNDIYKPDDQGYGREEHPHVTVLYGLITENFDAVKDLLLHFGQPWIEFDDKTSIFEPEGNDYDVVKVDVISSGLEKMNDALWKDFEVKTDHPDYKPHLTIAYVKKGTGKKYDGLPVKLKKMRVTELEFSDHNRKIKEFDLTKEVLSKLKRLPPPEQIISLNKLMFADTSVSQQIDEFVEQSAKDHVADLNQPEQLERYYELDALPRGTKPENVNATEWASKWKEAIKNFAQQHPNLSEEQLWDVVWSAFMGVSETNFEGGRQLANDLHDNYLMLATRQYLSEKVRTSSLVFGGASIDLKPIVEKLLHWKNTTLPGGELYSGFSIYDPGLSEILTDDEIRTLGFMPSGDYDLTDNLRVEIRKVDDVHNIKIFKYPDVVGSLKHLAMPLPLMQRLVQTIGENNIEGFDRAFKKWYNSGGKEMIQTMWNDEYSTYEPTIAEGIGVEEFARELIEDNPDAWEFMSPHMLLPGEVVKKPKIRWKNVASLDAGTSQLIFR